MTSAKQIAEPARAIACVVCGRSTQLHAPESAAPSDDELALPRGWRFLVLDPPLPVCSEHCADFIVGTKPAKR